MSRSQENILASADDDWSSLDSLGNTGIHTMPTQSTRLVSLDGLRAQALHSAVEHAKEVGVTLASALIEPLPDSPHAVLEFEGTARKHRVHKSVVVLGRTKELSDIVLDGDDQVSRHHAALIFTSGEFYVEDLESTNGSFINGRRIKRAKLHPGDILRVGNACLQLRWVD
jgi:hypothetical protein